MKLNKTHLFFIGLAVGLIGGNFLTSIPWKADQNERSANLDDVRTILIQTKMKSNKDSIEYNDKIAEMAALFYKLELENRELREKLKADYATVK